MTDQSTPSQAEQDAIRRGRIKAGALFMVALGPMLVATIMFYTGWGVPTATSNNGDLVPRGHTIFETGMTDSDGEALNPLFLPDNEDAKWWFLTVADDCGETCQDLLMLTRQVHISLNRESPRVKRAFHADDPTQAPLDEHPGLSLWDGTAPSRVTLPEDLSPADGPYIYIVDPMGNFVMRYDSSHIGRDILDDIRHLLKISPLG